MPLSLVVAILFLLCFQKQTETILLSAIPSAVIAFFRFVGFGFSLRFLYDRMRDSHIQILMQALSNRRVTSVAGFPISAGEI
jgi:hypothetical protein